MNYRMRCVKWMLGILSLLTFQPAMGQTTYAGTNAVYIGTTAISAAGAAAQSAAQLAAATDQVQNLDKKINDCNTGIRKITAEKARLDAGKQQYMNEIRRGEYCSGCNQTRSQILAKGETFPHSGQHILQPTQDDIDAKEREYDARIVAAADELLRLQGQVNKLSQERASALEAVEGGMRGWLDAIKRQGELLGVEFQARKKQQEDNIRGLQKSMAMLDEMERRLRNPDVLRETGQKPTPTPVNQAALDDIDKQRQAYRAGTGTVDQEIKHLSEKYNLDRAQWADDVNKGRDAIARAAALTGLQFYVPPSFRPPPLELEAGAFKFNLDKDKVGMGFGIGSVQAASDWLNSTTSLALTLEVGMGLKGIGKAGAGFTMERTQQWTPNGVSTTDKPSVYIKGSVMDVLEGDSRRDAPLTLGGKAVDKAPWAIR
jgi:hypothetical protein